MPVITDLKRVAPCVLSGDQFEELVAEHLLGCEVPESCNLSDLAEGAEIGEMVPGARYYLAIDKGVAAETTEHMLEDTLQQLRDGEEPMEHVGACSSSIGYSSVLAVLTLLGGLIDKGVLPEGSYVIVGAEFA